MKKCYKAVLLGESGIGSKTSLINVVIGGRFNQNTSSTSGASYCSKTFISKNGEEITIDFCILLEWKNIEQSINFL